MPKHNPVASDLEKVLKTLGNDETISVLVCTDLNNDAQQIVDYLKKLKAEHNYLGPSTGVVVAELTAKQIYGLAKQPYVSAIEKNGQVQAT